MSVPPARIDLLVSSQAEVVPAEAVLASLTPVSEPRLTSAVSPSCDCPDRPAWRGVLHCRSLPCAKPTTAPRDPASYERGTGAVKL
jgi:hypothetical protein